MKHLVNYQREVDIKGKLTAVAGLKKLLFKHELSVGGFQ